MVRWVQKNTILCTCVFIVLILLGGLTSSILVSGQFILQSPTEDQVRELYGRTSGDIGLSKVVGESSLIEMNYECVWWKFSKVYDVLGNLGIDYEQVR